LSPSKIGGVLRRNVLLFHNAAIGDFIVTWPLAVACGRLFPQSRIIYVTAAGKGKLAEHVLGVESIDIESGFSGLWSDGSTVTAGARRLVEGAHAVFSFVADDGGAWSRNVRSIAPHASIAHLSTKPPDDWNDHVARYIVQQLSSSHPAIASGTGQMIDSLERRGLGRRASKRNGVLIHPGSGAERKNWPRERFLELASRLKSARHDVRVVLGEVEIEKWGRPACDEFSSVAKVIQPQTPVDLAREIAEADVVVANDSGPAHLAAAIGVPTIALFGPTSNVTRWRPLGPAVTLIAGESMDRIAGDDVFRAAQSIEPSAPSANAEEDD
jgi:ADP-heptose:LPS heptosyltransferase